MTGHVAMVTTRVVLGVAGFAAAAYGTVTLLGLGTENLLATLPWLLGGVLAHDAVLAPLIVLAGVIAAARLPGWVRGAAAAALVVLGTVTLVAVPALGRLGARPDNPTLLDRPYAAGWAALAALLLVAAGTAALATRRRGGEHRG